MKLPSIENFIELIPRQTPASVKIFGSRVDIYFKNKKVLAKLGQNVVAGESLLASD